MTTNKTMRELAGVTAEEMRAIIHDRCHEVAGILNGMALVFAEEKLDPESVGCSTTNAIHIIAGAFMIADILNTESDLVEMLRDFVDAGYSEAMAELLRQTNAQSVPDDETVDHVIDKVC